jgi:hypothetical protein
MNRREMLVSAGGTAGTAAWGSLLAPVKALAAEVKPVRIKTIENFTIQIPASQTEVQAGVMSRVGVTRVVTESGVRGYSFGGGFGGAAAEAVVRARLIQAVVSAGRAGRRFRILSRLRRCVTL